MAIVLEIKGPRGQRRAEFASDRVTVGRSALCDLTLHDPGAADEQCVLIRRPEGVELLDIGESGGVLVNGKPASQAMLRPGDEVWVGATVFQVVPDDDTEAVSFTEGDATVREELTAPASEAAPARPDERFQLVSKVGRLIGSIGTDENIFELILDTMFSSVPVKRGFLALRNPEGDLGVKAQRRREQGTSGEKIEVSRTMLGRVMSSGKAVLTSDAEADADFAAARSIHRLRIKAAICVPLVMDGRVTGILYGDNREKPGALTKDHLALLTALASVASVAVEKFRLLDEYNQKLKIEQALAIARSIQLNFLPSAPPAVEGLDVAGRSESCDETGGDYFDYFVMRDGSLRVFVADVTGHGVGPALLMATGRSALRVLVDSEPKLENLMFRLNNHIRADVTDGRFITAFMGHVDPREGRFAHVGAGHTPPIWYRAQDRSTHLVTSGGPPLGILPSVEYRAGTTLPVKRGDVIVFTTDGIMEADRADGEQFGLDRLRRVVVEHASRSAQEILDAVGTAVDEFCGSRALRDDATLVVVKLS